MAPTVAWRGRQVLALGSPGGSTIPTAVAQVLIDVVVDGAAADPLDPQHVYTMQEHYVVDYSKQDFTQGDPRYDLILDNVASRSFSDLRRALADEGFEVCRGERWHY